MTLRDQLRVTSMISRTWLSEQLSFLPISALTFGEPYFFVWESRMKLRWCRCISAITMNRNAVRRGSSLGIVQKLDGKVDQIPVMVKDENFCVELRLAQRWPEGIPEKRGLFAGRHAHAGVIPGNV